MVSQMSGDGTASILLPGKAGQNPVRMGSVASQRECENEVCNSLPAVGSGLQARSVEAMEGTQGSYIHARIQNSEFEFWLYTDTVCFTGPDVDWRAEEWDARTPDELIQRVLAQAIQLVLKAEVDCA